MFFIPAQKRIYPSPPNIPTRLACTSETPSQTSSAPALEFETIGYTQNPKRRSQPDARHGDKYVPVASCYSGSARGPHPSLQLQNRPFHYQKRANHAQDTDMDGDPKNADRDIEAARMTLDQVCPKHPYPSSDSLSSSSSTPRQRRMLDISTYLA